MSEENKIKKITLLYIGIVFILIFLLECSITKSFSYRWSCSFLFGGIINLLCFFLSEVAIKKAFNRSKGSRAIFVVFNLLKLCLYALVFLFVGFFFLTYGVFLAGFGMLSIKIVISIRYLVIERIDDHRRKIDKLDISLETKEKLKRKDILKTEQLTQMSRDDLSSFLEEEEIEKISKELRKYGLFLKQELEVMLEDENDDES